MVLHVSLTIPQTVGDNRRGFQQFFKLLSVPCSRKLCVAVSWQQATVVPLCHPSTGAGTLSEHVGVASLCMVLLLTSAVHVRVLCRPGDTCTSGYNFYCSKVMSSPFRLADKLKIFAKNSDYCIS